jgi:serine O-acetyltransferase
VTQEKQIERIVAVMKAEGLSCPSVPECDKFDSAQLNKLVD